MKKEFWHQKWEENQIGFHQSDINGELIKFWNQLKGENQGRVFVPFCGKTLDMLWVAKQGHQVVGVELSPLAIKAFFNENNLTPREETVGDLTLLKTDEFELYCGDLFHLAKELVKGCDLIYDRAALVALPPNMRPKYANSISSLFQAGTRMLLITFEYKQEKMTGPPFPVSENEVKELYSNYFSIEILSEREALKEYPKFTGIDSLIEKVFLLVKK